MWRRQIAVVPYIRGARATSPCSQVARLLALNKSHIWLSHVTFVVVVRQQDGDKKEEKSYILWPFGN
jgi:hypothetical protein